MHQYLCVFVQALLKVKVSYAPPAGAQQVGNVAGGNRRMFLLPFISQTSMGSSVLSYCQQQRLIFLVFRQLLLLHSGAGVQLSNRTPDS